VKKIKSCLSKNDCFVQLKKGVERKGVQGWFYSRALALKTPPLSLREDLYLTSTRRGSHPPQK